MRLINGILDIYEFERTFPMVHVVLETEFDISSNWSREIMDVNMRSFERNICYRHWE